LGHIIVRNQRHSLFFISINIINQRMLNVFRRETVRYYNTHTKTGFPKTSHSSKELPETMTLRRLQ
jgi:hypothetical protein